MVFQHIADQYGPTESHVVTAYRLAGHCYGGLVAYEIAQRLRRAGETVEMLVMFDAPNMASDATAPLPRADNTFGHALLRYRTSPASLLNWIRARLALGTRLRAWHSLVRGRPLSEETRKKVFKRSRLVRAWNALALLLGRTVPATGRPNYALHVMERAVGAYRPAPYDGDIVLVHSGSEAGGVPERRFTDGMLGWADRSRDTFRYLRVDADHTGIIDHPATAEMLRTRLTALGAPAAA